MNIFQCIWEFMAAAERVEAGEDICANYRTSSHSVSIEVCLLGAFISNR